MPCVQKNESKLVFDFETKVTDIWGMHSIQFENRKLWCGHQGKLRYLLEFTKKGLTSIENKTIDNIVPVFVLNRIVYWRMKTACFANWKYLIDTLRKCDILQVLIRFLWTFNTGAVLLDNLSSANQWYRASKLSYQVIRTLILVLSL